MSERQCLECKQPISGRSDKRFCGDQCRNVYNNRDQREHKRNIYKVNRRLLQNYRILRKLNKGDKTKVTHKKLLDAAFSFSHITSIYRTKAGKTYYFVYDQGYLPLDNDWYVLVKRQDWD